VNSAKSLNYNYIRTFLQTACFILINLNRWVNNLGLIREKKKEHARIASKNRIGEFSVSRYFAVTVSNNNDPLVERGGGGGVREGAANGFWVGWGRACFFFVSDIT